MPLLSARTDSDVYKRQASNIMTVGVVKPQLNVYHSLPYSISLFFLQVKPFYTDMFYLHSPVSYTHLDVYKRQVSK